MYQTSDIRKGLKIEVDGAPWIIVDFQFVKPGKGQAFTRTKQKNLITGNVVDRTYKTGEVLQPAEVEEVDAQYLYNDGEYWHFMNLQNYEQVAIGADAMGDASKWLVEEMSARVMLYKARPVSVEAPTFVELEIVETEPGVKGNTVQGGSKAATLPTGATIQVPLFLETGTIVKIDTRTGEYIGRVTR